MKSVITYIYLIFLGILVSQNAFTQGEGNIWYFGTNAGIDFNSGSPVALTDGALSTFEGCATICDASGTLLFYTDGINVYNSIHNTMPNGTELIGNSTSTQSGIIVYDPGNANRYYIFTVGKHGVGKCAYSIVDMTLDGGLGDIDTLKNIVLQNTVSEKITAVPHINGIDVWIITQSFGTSKYYAYLLTPSGVNSTPVISNSGGISQTGGITAAIGYLKANHNGTKIAAAIRANDLIEIYDFNNSTGILSNAITFPAVCSDVYGVEFSPNDNILYFTSCTDGSIYQVDMMAGSANNIIASTTFLAFSNSSWIGALQVAIDGKIYMARHTSEYVAVINNPNVWGAGCNYIDNGFYLGGQLSRLGLPNFVPNLFISYTFTYENFCFGENTPFSIVDTLNLDSVYWNFDDPSSGIDNNSVSFSPQHVFTNPGLYNVQLITYESGNVDTSIQQVSINPLPNVNLGPDTNFCLGGSVTLDAGIGFNSYLWNTGETTQSIEVSNIGLYTVTVTDAIGCVGSDDNDVRLTPDVAISSNSIIGCEPYTVNFNSTYSAQYYVWDFGDSSELSYESNPSHTFSNAGVYNVTLTVTSNLGCVNSVVEQDLINIYPKPNAKFINNPEMTSILNPEISFSNLSNNHVSSYWDFGDGGYSNSENPSHLFPIYTGDTYNVLLIVETANGCLDSVFGEVIIRNEYTFYAPTAFSPDNDGLNDKFFVFGNGIDNSNFILNVYDRWGELIYESHNLYEGWNGRIKGGAIGKNGCYTWHCTYKNDQGLEHQETGVVTIIR